MQDDARWCKMIQDDGDAVDDYANDDDDDDDGDEENDADDVDDERFQHKRHWIGLTTLNTFLFKGSTVLGHRILRETPVTLEKRSLLKQSV